MVEVWCGGTLRAALTLRSITRHSCLQNSMLRSNGVISTSSSSCSSARVRRHSMKLSRSACCSASLSIPFSQCWGSAARQRGNEVISKGRKERRQRDRKKGGREGWGEGGRESTCTCGREVIIGRMSVANCNRLEAFC